MGKIGATMPNFCLNRIRPLVRIRPPSINIHESKKNQTNKTHDQQQHHHHHPEEEKKEVDHGNINGYSSNGGGAAKMVVIGRKIMIVVDSSDEAKNALQWALTHTVQSQDMVILLYVSTKSSSNPAPANDHKIVISPRVSHFLSCMKMMCQQKRPEVKIEVAVAEGKEKGRVIVEEAKKQGVGVLVIGQKKRSTTWRLVMMWAGHNKVGNGGGGVVEYCIQNASCMAIAVRRKSKKAGGYLITTKRHKDFWLLA